LLAITFVAAFYEASGASACRSGFYVPVEASAPPQWVLLEDKPLAAIWQGLLGALGGVSP